jgi:asparagine synthase (glutamine-hydrolysing)
MLPVATEPANRGSERAYAERAWELLGDSVRLRLMGERPLGVLLSGGIDSSTIARLAAERLERPLQTFTIDFPNAWKGEDRDAHYAALVAEAIGSEHHTFVVEPDAYFAALQRLAWHLERPFNKGAATMFLLYERLRTHATVVLCGEGADELLAGYVGSPGLGLDDVLRDGEVRGFPWAPYWAVTLRLLAPDVAKAWRPRERHAAAVAAALAEFPTTDVLNRALLLYLRYFLLELLEFHDRTSLAFGVEARPPFLDHRLVELLAPLPSALKVRNNASKALFRELLKGYLPDAVLTRTKSHMPIPRDPRSIRRQVALTRQLVLGPETRSRRFFDPAKLEDFLALRGEFEGVPMLAVWQITMYLITLELLHRAFDL